MPFYVDKLSEQIRFGDVLSVNAALAAEIVSCNYPKISVSVEINSGNKVHFAVLTPCCTMAKCKAILLSPFEKLNRQYFETSGIKDNILKANINLIPRDAIPDRQWDNKGKDDQQLIIEAGLKGVRTYTRSNEFLYAENERFDEYERTVNGNKKNITYYVIDFCNAYSLGINKVNIKRGAAENSLYGHKVLELSPLTRRQLRFKLAAFYRRITPEDNNIIGDDPNIIEEL